MLTGNSAPRDLLTHTFSDTAIHLIGQNRILLRHENFLNPYFSSQFHT
jgi:hypothetical protein